MYYKSRAIILKTRDLRETDKLVWAFTEKEGKISAVARGVKKPKSSLRACIQPFCHSLLFMSRGKELDLITQGKILDFFGNSREDINRTLYSVYIMELLDKSLMERVAFPDLYLTLVSVLEKLNEQGLNLLLVRFFEGRLLSQLGYQPVIDRCTACGSENLNNCRFSLPEGGLLCASCSKGGGNAAMVISGESLALLRLISRGHIKALQRVKASPGAMRQVEILLEKYLEYYLERKFKVKNTISLLKKRVIEPIDNHGGSC